MMKTIFMLMSLFWLFNMSANSAQAPTLDTKLVSPPSSTAEKPEPDTETENTTATQKSAEAYIKSANYAQQEGNLKLVRKILKDGYESTQEVGILSQWLVIDKSVLQDLEKKHQLNSVTEWTSEFENKCLKQAHTSCSEYERQKAISTQEQNTIAIPQIEDVNITLTKYEQLKGSQIDRESLLDAEFMAKSDSKTILEQHQTQIHELTLNRCQYLSFDVISPYLARTKQLIFQAKINKPEGSSLLTLVSDSSLKKVREVKILHEAAKILVNVGFQGMIFESDVSVQQQFLNLYEKFKQTEGAKFKEFKEIEKIAMRLKKENKAVSCGG